MTTWRVSSYSNNGSCVAVAQLGDRVAIRNSNHPDRGAIALSSASVAAFVAGCSAGLLDDLT
jgi:hypothetical protein